MTDSFDVVVIGTGTAAASIAGRCRKAGRSVAIVDERPYGGTCALRGCDPKKLLRRGPEIVDAARRAEGNGIAGDGPRVDWPALVAFKRGYTDPIPARRQKSFADSGIATFCGTARFLDARTVAVGEQRLQGRHLAIATGAKPRPLGIPGEALLTDSTGFMELPALPPRLLFVGGGYVSFEFAHMAARAGADVTVLTRGERPLGGFDPDLVDRLVERSRAAGIDLRTGAEVEAVARSGDSLTVQASVGGRRESFVADLAVHGAGRVPAVEALALDAAGIKASAKGIEVDAHLQSVSNPAVYAAGDVAATAGAPLTPVASLEGGIAAENILGGDSLRPDYGGIPSVVFTLPALARVGLLEQEASEQGLAFETKLSDMAGWYSTRRVGESHAAAKILIEREGGRLLGAHLLGPESAELANLFALAMQSGLTAGDLKRFIGAYPTGASDISHLL